MAIRDNGELELLLNWPDRRTRPEWLAIFSASIAFHLIVFVAFVKVPSLIGQRAPEREVVEHRIKLYLPPELMTQKAPNRAPVSKSVDLADLQPSQANPSAPKRFHPPPQPKPAAPARPTPPSILAQAPAVAMNGNPNAAQARGYPGGLPQPLPPQPTPGPFQNLSEGPATPNPHPKLSPPKANVADAVKELAQQSPPQAERSVSDDVPDVAAGALGSAGQLPAQHSAVELQSDPNGADFKPYLKAILTIVRTNWRRVIPESARMGSLRGRTVLEFIINRDGSIPKLVTADSSGSEPLDRAAVAGLSMSNPLPPLPADYKGAQIRLAFTFAYNMPAR